MKHCRKKGSVIWNFLSCVIFLSSAVVFGKREDSVSIVFGGDVQFSRMIQYLHDTKNCSYENTLRRVQPFLEESDFTIVNLETTVKKDHQAPLPKVPEKLVNIVSDESALPAIKNIGIDGVTLANNHINDYKTAGVKETVHLLNKYKIPYTGINFGDPYARQKPITIEKNGVKIGILGYCDIKECADFRSKDSAGTALMDVGDRERTIQEIDHLRKTGYDIIILYLHGGKEYTSMLAQHTLYQIDRLLKKTKVDLVVGAHPHVTHKHWYANNTLIATSLGNLLFTPFLQANHNFNEMYYNRSEADFYAKLWYRQSIVMKDATNYGRLLKVEFNKNGIIRNKSFYLGTEIYMTENYCLVAKVKKGSKWRKVCGRNDHQCIGTATCNYLQCDGDEPLPMIKQNHDTWGK